MVLEAALHPIKAPGTHAPSELADAAIHFRGPGAFVVTAIDATMSAASRLAWLFPLPLNSGAPLTTLLAPGPKALHALVHLRTLGRALGGFGRIPFRLDALQLRLADGLLVALTFKFFVAKQRRGHQVLPQGLRAGQLGFRPRRINLFPRLRPNEHADAPALCLKVDPGSGLRIEGHRDLALLAKLNTQAPVDRDQMQRLEH